MKKIILLFVFLSLPAVARERFWSFCQQGNIKATVSGLQSTNVLMGSYPSCTIRVTNNGTNTLSTLYSDNNGTPLANPFVANSVGFFFFYGDDGRYDANLSGGNLPAPWTIGDILLGDKPNSPPTILDFGCKGDGVTNDTACIQTAINSVEAAGVSLIVAGGKNFCIGTVTITGPLQMYGPGSFKRCVSLSSGVGMFDITGQKVTLRDFSIDGQTTTPTQISYLASPSPFDANQTANTSIWIHGGSSNITISNLTINHTGGFAGFTDARAGNISRVAWIANNVTNSRSTLFGTPSFGFGFGGWTGGLFYANDGINFSIDDLLYDGNNMLQGTGNMIWGHANTLTLQNTNVRVINNYCEDAGLDCIQMANVNGGLVAHNYGKRIGYVAYNATSPASDVTFGAPRWIPTTPTSIPAVMVDTSGIVTNVDYNDNSADAINGGWMDGDGYGWGTVRPGVGTSCWVSNDPHAQPTLCGAGSNGINVSYGWNSGNSQAQARADVNVNLLGGQYNGFGGGAIRIYGCSSCKVSNAVINHPNTAITTPISYGPFTANLQTFRAANSEISNNTVYWSPTTGAIVSEDAAFGAFLASDVNLVHDNRCIGTSGIACYELVKNNNSSTTSGPIRFSSVTAQAQGIIESVLQTQGTTNNSYSANLYADIAGTGSLIFSCNLLFGCTFTSPVVVPGLSDTGGLTLSGLTPGSGGTPLCLQGTTVYAGGCGGGGGGGGGLADPGANGPVYRTALNVTAVATGAQLGSVFGGCSAGSPLLSYTGGCLPTGAGVTSFNTRSGAVTLLVADVNGLGTLTNSTTGNAATATALSLTPTLCTTGQAPTGILANGNATGCASITGGSGVSSFNTRTGAVTLTAADVNAVGGITNNTTGTAAALTGTPTICSAGQAPRGILSNGNATGCAVIAAAAAWYYTDTSGSTTCGLQNCKTIAAATHNQGTIPFVFCTDTAPSSGHYAASANYVVCPFEQDPSGAAGDLIVSWTGTSVLGIVIEGPGSGGGGGGGGLADPGANGIIKRTSFNVTAPAVSGTDYAPATTGSAILKAAAGGFAPAVAADVALLGNLSNNTTGTASTAIAFSAIPTLCPTGQAPTGILANGNATGCAAGSGGVNSFNTRTGAVTLTAADVNGVGAITNNTAGTAATATTLAVLPTPCPAGQAPTGILANGNSTGCAAFGESAGPSFLVNDANNLQTTICALPTAGGTVVVNQNITLGANIDNCTVGVQKAAVKVVKIEGVTITPAGFKIFNTTPLGVGSEEYNTDTTTIACGTCPGSVRPITQPIYIVGRSSSAPPLEQTDAAEVIAVATSDSTGVVPGSPLRIGLSVQNAYSGTTGTASSIFSQLELFGNTGSNGSTSVYANVKTDAATTASSFALFGECRVGGASQCIGNGVEVGPSAAVAAQLVGNSINEPLPASNFTKHDLFGTLAQFNYPSPELTVTDLVSTGSTTVTSVTGGFTTAMIGDHVAIIGAGICKMTARTNTNTAVLDCTVATGTGQTAYVGVNPDTGYLAQENNGHHMGGFALRETGGTRDFFAIQIGSSYNAHNISQFVNSPVSGSTNAGFDNRMQFWRGSNGPFDTFPLVQNKNGVEQSEIRTDITSNGDFSQGYFDIYTNQSAALVKSVRFDVNGMSLQKSLRMAPTTVGGLGSCTAPLDGTEWFVTDALTPVPLASVASGGAAHVPVYCDGATLQWKVQ